MIVVNSVQALEQAVAEVRDAQKSIGLVPTMGALHEGHASLVRQSVSENGCTVVSVFVNPTQFNDKNDLSNYPRDLEADTRLLSALGVDIVFAPTVEAVYPEPDNRVFSYPPIDAVMEGARRPGHFNGVCQIVSKLFMWVQPDRAYFGEKDYQQIAVVRAMVRDQGFHLELRPCPIVREESGLALSSRNALLTPAERVIASHIYATLTASVEFAHTHSVVETQAEVVRQLNATEGLEVEYFQIVDGQTLQPVTQWDEADSIVGCITVYCGSRPVRLIDNIKYKG
ncbi:MAG: pantoate--beta-alanine ligase [Bacteroidales bacterium]|nr:pantoate--beta-alanine ligase [Bacteroidales bacterium]